MCSDVSSASGPEVTAEFLPLEAFHDQLPARTPHGEEQEHRRWDRRQRQQREESVPESAQVRCTGPFVFAVCSKYGAFELNRSLLLFAVSCPWRPGASCFRNSCRLSLEQERVQTRSHMGPAAPGSPLLQHGVPPGGPTATACLAEGSRP